MPASTMSQVFKTVAISTTAQSLYSLLIATFPNLMRQGALIEVWGDDVLLAGQLCYCGDALVSSTNHAFVIASGGDVWRFNSKMNQHSIMNKYLRADGGTPSVNISIVCA